MAGAPLDGLNEDAVIERVRRGEVNEVPKTTSRTTWQIVRANVLTPFNALLGTLFVVILTTGAPQDALFGVVLIANTAIGIVQELRAKRTLDQLAVLTTPQTRVVRSGTVGEIQVNQVVVDDVLELHPGDQIVVDGTVLASNGLEVDESLLSGESEPLDKNVGAEVLSGSFVAAGTGRYRATRVGRAAYAASLAEQAKRFTVVRSELRDGINRILKYVTWAILPTASLLFVSQFRLHESATKAIQGAVAGIVGMVPEGLVLLTSVAFGVAVVRLARNECWSRSFRRLKAWPGSTCCVPTRPGRSLRDASRSRISRFWPREQTRAC
jgi:magnesium-transporting ATPase (P-type)